MPDFFYLVRVQAPDKDRADLVITERLQYEEELQFNGQPFDYQIDLANPQQTVTYTLAPNA